MRILYLDLDTLRPDHLGCYGYHRNTSPNIDRIAAEGVRFDNYHCSDAPCLPSRTALMTGRFGIHTGVVGHGGTAADMRLEGAAARLPHATYLDQPARDAQGGRAAHLLHRRLRRAPLALLVLRRLPRDPRHGPGRHGVGRGGDPHRAGLDRAQRRARQLVSARQLLGPAHALPRARGVRQSVRRRSAARVAHRGGAGRAPRAGRPAQRAET